MPVKQYFPRLSAADAKWNTQFVDNTLLKELPNSMAETEEHLDY